MWLLESNVKKAMEQGDTPTAEQQALFQAQYFDNGSEGGIPSILTTAGNTAEIAIKGVLTNTPNFMAALFGGGNTTYSDIISAIAIAEQDEAIENIIYLYDSPGGEIDGLFNTIAVMKAVQKPNKAVVVNLAASAAYALAAQANKIEAVNQASRVGSVGVVASFYIDENQIEITNTESPNKRPDITTESGKAVIRAQLDPMYGIFADAIAIGRNTTVEKINADYGQGATFLANEALKNGMIDSIVNNVDTLTARNVGQTIEAKAMDINELKAKHADVYAAVLKEGADTERTRVNAHLTMGSGYGDMATAITAIKEGSPLNDTLIATYLTAGKNKDDLNAAAADSLAAAAAAADSLAADNQGDPGEQVAALIEAKLSMEV